MKTPSSLATKTLNIIKLFFILCFGVLFIVASSILLKKLCLGSVQAEGAEYLLFTEPTPLYSSSDCSSPVITLPEGYYATVLNHTDDLVRVEYNTITGFVRLSSTTELTSSRPETLYQTAELKTASDAGTQLRTEPNTTSAKLTIVPPGTELTYIGEISGTRPTDGTSTMWYYVHFDSGATTTHTGYVYSERTVVISGKLERPITASTSTTGTTDELTTPDELTAEQSASTPISAGLKIFLVILFATLGLIIFALLVISPHEKKESKRRVKHKTSDSFVENYANLDENRTKNGDFLPKNAKKLTISDNFSFKSSKTQANSTEIPRNSKDSSTKILSETARMDKNRAKTTKNGTFFTKNDSNLHYSRENYAPTDAEFGDYLEFDQPTYHSHSQHSSPETSRSRKRELRLMSEKKGSPLPRVLQRYFSIEEE